MVTLVLVGVALGEADQRAVEGVAAAEVGPDCVGSPERAAPGPGSRRTVSPIGSPAPAAIISLGLRDALPVTQLADVEVALAPVDASLVRSQPRKMSLARLHQPLAARPPAGPCWLVLAGADEPARGPTRLCLLRLQEQRSRIRASAFEHQDDPRSGFRRCRRRRPCGPCRTNYEYFWSRNAAVRLTSSVCRVFGDQMRAVERLVLSPLSARARNNSSSIGTMQRRVRQMIRGWPSTTRVSLATACMLSLVRAWPCPRRAPCAGALSSAN